MPHWIKRVVNGLENSSKDSHKRCLMYKGKPLGLGMIKTAWEAVELGGISTLRQTKLTIGHFNKNPHSRMRVFLAAQVLSSSVYRMLKQYVDGDSALKDGYSSLMTIIWKLDKLVDIWNHPSAKGYTFIDCPDHGYIKELESILALMTDWRNETKALKNPWAGFSPEIYNDLCWIVYGLKGVSDYYLHNDKK